MRLKTRVRKGRKYWVAWGHDSNSKDLIETVLSEVNDLLLDKGLEIRSWDDEESEYDYKITLELDEVKQ
tara:strand:- start:1060 stop:1266 length:207 start_codon:yes stop_codon:yes gene_type:complete